MNLLVASAATRQIHQKYLIDLIEILIRFDQDADLGDEEDNFNMPPSPNVTAHYQSGLFYDQQKIQ